MNPYKKERYAVDEGAHPRRRDEGRRRVRRGLGEGSVTPEMLKTMASNPIVFAMANPDPEIPYPLAVATRKDVIMATGESDYPNRPAVDVLTAAHQRLVARPG